MALRKQGVVKFYDDSKIIELYTDSKYVQNGITDWIDNWKKNGWLNASKKPVKNIELWKELDAMSKFHKVDWYWVKGHSTHRENDLADALANRGIEELI